MSRSSFRLTMLALATFVGAVGSISPLSAQQPRIVPSQVPALSTVTIIAAPASVAPASLGPRTAPAGIDTRAATDSASPLVPQQGRHLGAGSNLALMGAGAAAIIVGLMIGGDGGTIVAITGGVIGLVGLFRFIR